MDKSADKLKVALIANDEKKAAMVAFVMKRLKFFNNPIVEIVATGTTGSMIVNSGVSKVERVSSGPLGGDAEIGAMITRGEIDAIVFLRDPLGKHPHDVDISMLLRLCDVHNVPLATNIKSATILISYFERKVKKWEKQKLQ